MPHTTAWILLVLLVGATPRWASASVAEHRKQARKHAALAAPCIVKKDLPCAMGHLKKAAAFLKKAMASAPLKQKRTLRMEYERNRLQRAELLHLQKQWLQALQLYDKCLQSAYATLAIKARARLRRKALLPHVRPVLDLQTQAPFARARVLLRVQGRTIARRTPFRMRLPHQGTALLRISHPQARPKLLRIELQPGKTYRKKVALTPLPKKPVGAAQIAAWILGGLAVACLATAVPLIVIGQDGIDAVQKKQGLAFVSVTPQLIAQRDQDNQRLYQQLQAGQQLTTAGFGLLAAAAVVGLAGAIVYLARPKPKKKTAALPSRHQTKQLPVRCSSKIKPLQNTPVQFCVPQGK